MELMDREHPVGKAGAPPFQRHQHPRPHRAPPPAEFVLIQLGHGVVDVENHAASEASAPAAR